MIRRLLLLIALSTALLGAPVVSAQNSWPPTIFLFTLVEPPTPPPPVTVNALEAGELSATLHWHVAHVAEGQRVMLYVFRVNAWVPLIPDEVLPPVGERTITLEHPRTFAPPAYRLAVLDRAGRVLDERTLVIPYDEAALETAQTTVYSFSALDQTVNAADLSAGRARVRVSWVLRDRSPLAHLVFEQVLADGTTTNVELPRPELWVPSTGTGIVAPVAPPADAPDNSTIRLRLRAIDVISAETLAEKEVSVAILGTALPPTPSPAGPAASPTPAVQTFGDLTVQPTCTLFPPGVPTRGWVDSPGIPSPDGRYLLYVTNSVGDAELVVARADGSGQVKIDAPDKTLPLWSRPRWSPDSQRIAFASIALSAPGGGTLYVVRADGSDLRKLAPYTGYYDDIAWSQDGVWLYYTSGEVASEGTGIAVQGYRVWEVRTDGLGTPEPVAEGCGLRP